MTRAVVPVVGASHGLARRCATPLFALGVVASACVQAQGFGVFDAAAGGIMTMPDMTGPGADIPGSGRPGRWLQPTLDASATLTDNYRLSSTNRQSDLVLQVSPGLRLNSSTGRMRGFLNYSLTGVAYANHRDENNFQNSLDADLMVEAIENHLFVDLGGSISQQSVSAFGQQSNDPTLVNPNRTEVATYRVSPYLRGWLGDLATYEARLTYQTTHASAASNSSSGDAVIQIASDRAFSSLGWSIDLSRQMLDFAEGNRTFDDRVRGSLIYHASSDLNLSLIVGHENTDLGGPVRQSQGTAGLGVNWRPSARTTLTAERESRAFGNSYSMTFEHRLPRSVIRYADRRDASTGQSLRGSQGTNYDLLFNQFASIQPDPVKRAQLVNDFLTSNGISPTASVPGGTLPSAALDQRQQELSFAWLGQRDTVTLTAARSDSSQIDPAATGTGDFANGNHVIQQGFTLDVSHRLTPRATLTLTAQQSRSRGSVSGDSSRLRTLNAAMDFNLNSLVRLTFGGRHNAFANASAPYTESALYANVNLGF